MTTASAGTTADPAHRGFAACRSVSPPRLLRAWVRRQSPATDSQEIRESRADTRPRQLRRHQRGTTTACAWTIHVRPASRPRATEISPRALRGRGRIDPHPAPRRRPNGCGSCQASAASRGSQSVHAVSSTLMPMPGASPRMIQPPSMRSSTVTNGAQPACTTSIAMWLGMTVAACAMKSPGQLTIAIGCSKPAHMAATWRAPVMPLVRSLTCRCRPRPRAGEREVGRAVEILTGGDGGPHGRRHATQPSAIPTSRRLLDPEQVVRALELGDRADRLLG